MATWEDLLERNQQYAETQHIPKEYASERKKPPPPFFIVSCMDFRVSIEDLLQIKSEESRIDAFIVRNAGGRIDRCVNDILFLEAYSRERALKQVVVIHHTDCGFTHNTDEKVREGLKSLKDPSLAEEIDKLRFGTFGSPERLEESVREDLKFLKAHSLIRQDLKASVKGYIYDIKTGKLKEIVESGV